MHNSTLFPRKWLAIVGVFLLSWCVVPWAARGQTTLINPLTQGGFESGASFAANGWGVTSNGPANWALGTAAPGYSGARAAYISPDGGPTYLHGGASSSINHLYRNVTFPAGESKIAFTFRLRIDNPDCCNDAWDHISIWSMPDVAVPSGGSALVASVDNILIGPGNNPTPTGRYGTGTGGTFLTYSVDFPSYFAGTTRKIVIQYQEAAGAPFMYAAVDDISLVSNVPSNISSTAIGGLWNSPATWVGGVVPSNDNVTIAAGATVTVNQNISINNLIVNGNLNWTGATAPTNAITGNITVNASGRMNVLTPAPNPLQVNLNWSGSTFTNNGYVNLAYGGLICQAPSGTVTVTGGGTFEGEPGGRGVIRVFQFATMATVNITTTQVIATHFPAHTGGTLNAGGKLEIDNTAVSSGNATNQGVYVINVTAMGSGYNSATPPTVTIAAPPAGTQATAVPNIDDVSGTLRSITITLPGDGYRVTNPAVSITGGSGTGAAATAFVSVPNANTGLGNSTLQKTGVAPITGSMPINSSQGVGTVYATTPGAGYGSAPTVGFQLPTGIMDLVTAGGAGYTAAPTITWGAGCATNPTGVVTVANGEVTGLQITGGGTNCTAIPTITFVGGGGAGAAASFPAGCLATATANISNGMVSSFTVTNAGSGYLVAPTVTLTGGGFTTAAVPVSRIGLYNLTYGFFAPAPTNATSPEGSEIPTNRRINALTMNTTAGITFTGNLTLYSATPYTATAGPMFFGANSINFENKSYAGITPTGTNGVGSGSIIMNSFGAAINRTFPFLPSFIVNPGTGTGAAGSNITSYRLTRTGAPTGTVSPSGTPTGLRTYTLDVLAGTTFGTNPLVTLNWNAGDNLGGDQPGLFVAQSNTGIGGPWTIRSLTSGAGAIPATGNRSTATGPPGPIVFGPSMRFGFATTTSLPAPLAYNVTRSTGISFTSVFPGGTNFSWTGTSTDDNVSNSLDISALGFNFSYQGAPVTNIKAATNGFLYLDAAGTATGVTNLASGANAPLIAPFWDDLVVVPNNGTLASLNASIRYDVTGVAPNRQLIVEWRNMSFFGAAGPNMNFQVVLSETSNNIQINYGLFQGFNGTNNHRPTYTTGLRGSFVSSNPQPGEVFMQQFENFNLFSNAFTASTNQGSNGLLEYPACNSRLSFTPGAYTPPAPPSIVPPANDNRASAFGLSALVAFPSNLCGYYYSSRGATASPDPVCGGNANDDVWFKFTPDADPGNVPFAFDYIVRIYASGGYVPRVEVLDNSGNPLPTPVCVGGLNGGTLDASLVGLTPGLEYFIRVYHDEGPASITGLLSAVVSGGSVVSSFVTSGQFGAGYTTTTSGSFTGTKAVISGGGGAGATIGVGFAGGQISTFTIGSGGFGYSSAPTITLESPAYGVQGAFAIVVFQYVPPQPNNLPANVTTLTVQSGSCSSQLTGQTTFNAIDIPGPVLANSCAGSGLGNPDDDLWYRFLANSNNATVQMTGFNTFSPVFQYYDAGTNPADLDPTLFTHLGCSNNPGVNGLATASFSTVSGRYYWIRAYSPPTGNPDPNSNFSICVFSVPPFAYNFSQSSGVYTPIVGGTVVTRVNTDDATYHTAGESTGGDTQIGFNIGFPFTYQGLAYNQFVANSNGWIMLGNAAITFSTSTGYNMMSGALDGNIIAPYNGDLDGNNVGSELRFQTTGAIGNRVCTIQYKDYKAWGAAPTTDILLNFQITLNEVDNSVRFNYGPSTLQAAATRYIGVKGGSSSTASFNTNARTTSVTVATAVNGDINRTTFQNGTGGGVSVSAANTPAGLSGIQFAYLPTVCDADIPVTTAPTLTNFNNVDLNWTAAAGEVNGYDIRYRRGVDDIAGYTTVSVGTGITTVNVITLQPATVYIYEVRTKCASGQSEWSIARSFTTPSAPNDVRVLALVQPLQNGLTCFSNAMTAIITIRNVGSAVVPSGTNIPVSLTVTGPVNTNLNEVFTLGANLNPNTNVNYTFTGTVDMSGTGAYVFNSSTAWVLDDFSGNDALDPAVTINGYPSNVPAPTYSQGFNAPAPGLALQNVSGTNGWVLTGVAQPLRDAAPLANLSAQEGSGYFIYDAINAGTSTARVVSPCFTVPACYEVSFRHSRWNAQDNGSGTSIRVSTNGGTTWSALLSIYNATENRPEGTIIPQYLSSASSPVWQHFTVDLSSYAGQTLRIAYEGINVAGGITRWGVDNMVIREKTLDDVGISALIAPVSNSSCGISNATVTVRIFNYGCNPQTNIPVTVTVTGATPAVISNTYVGAPIPGGGFVNFNVGTINTVASGIYNISASTVLPGDQDLANNNLAPIPILFKQNPIVTNVVTPQNIVFGAGANASVTGTATVSIPQSVFSNATPAAVADGIGGKGQRGPVTTSSITIGTLPGFTLASSVVSITINATHGYSSDLDFEIQAPNGLIYNLHTNASTAAGANITGMRFVASGAPSVTTGAAPYNGNWLPQTPFSAYTGPANGTWTLRVFDNWSILTGQLDNWSIEFGSVLTNVTWACPTCPGAPVAFPLVNNTPPATVPTVAAIGATYPIGIYQITLSALDDQGCSTTLDQALNVFTTNQWLGNTSDWFDPSNWQSSPAPPTSLVAVNIPTNPVGGSMPSILGVGNSGSMTLQPGSSLSFGDAASRLNVAALWTGNSNQVTGPGRVVMSGSTVQSILGTTHFENLEINKTAGTTNILGTANINGVLTISNNTSPLNINPAGKLVLRSTPTRTGMIGPVPAGASITGNVTMERYVPHSSDGSWFFIGSPITGENFTDWVDNFKVVGLNTGYGVQGSGIINSHEPERATIFKYMENTHNVRLDTVQKHGWRIPGNENIAIGTGYRVFIDKYSNSTSKFNNIGTVFTGPLNFPALTRNEYANCVFGGTSSWITPGNPCVERDRGWNLLSNPYPSSIDWDAASWTKPAQMNNAFYTFNTGLGAYQVYLGTTGTPGTVAGGWDAAISTNVAPSVIPSSQAFFVKLTAAGSYSSTLSVSENAKTSTNGTFVRTSVSVSQVRFRLTNTAVPNYGYDGVIRFDDNSTYGFDQNKDVHALGGSSFDFSMVSDDEPLIISTIPLLNETKVIPLNMNYRGRTGSFRFSFLEVNSLSNGAEMYLRDNYLGILTSINDQSGYDFSVDASNGSSVSNRFEIVINPGVLTGTNKVVDGVAIGVYPNPASGNSNVNISVAGLPEGVVQVVVVDMVGKVVFQSEMNVLDKQLTEKSVNLGVAAGMYTVKLISGNKLFTEKLVIR